GWPCDKAVQQADHVGSEGLAGAPKRRRHLPTHELQKGLPPLLVGKLSEMIDGIVRGRQPGKRREPRVPPPNGMTFGDGADGGTRVLGAAAGELVTEPRRRQILQQHHEVAAWWVGGAEMHFRNTNAVVGPD